MPVTLSKIDWKVISGIPQDAPSGVHDFDNVEASYYSVCTSNLKYKLTCFQPRTIQKNPTTLRSCYMDLFYGKKNLQKSADNQTDNNGFPSVGIEIAVGHWRTFDKIFNISGQN